MADQDQLGADELPPPPPGTQYLLGADGAYLTRPDGTLLLGRVSESDARAAVAETLADLQVAIAEIKKQTSQIGHNNPPEPIYVSVSEAEQAAAQVQEQVNSSAPDKSILTRAKAKFKELSIEAKALLALAASTAAEDGSKSVGHMVWAQIEPWASRLVEALAHWIATIP